MFCVRVSCSCYLGARVLDDGLSQLYNREIRGRFFKQRYSVAGQFNQVVCSEEML